MAKLINEFELDNVTFKVDKDGKTAYLEADNQNLFVEKAEEAGIDKKELKKTLEFAADYFRKAGEVITKEVAKIMKDDDSIQEAIATMPFGINKSDRIESYIEREHEYPNPSKPGEKIKTPVIRHTAKTKWSGLGKKYISDLKEEFKSILGE